jgi:ABC-type multidrug transport system ATPase subunit
LGPNGAGKSTLMRTIAALQDSDEGTITVGDIDVSKDKQSLREILGYLPQEFGVYPKISANDLLDHLAVMKGIIDSKQRKEVVESLLHQTNLWEAKDQKLGTYSGGMKQRFGIAQALIGDPKLIIVDEPTAGLDPMERNRFHNLLSEIGENVIVILSTHIVDDVSDLCNNMAIILNGEVHLVGEPIQLIKTLDQKVWKGLIEKSELVEIEKENDVISSRLYLGKVQVRIFSESPMQNGFESVNPEIEDLYFATINGLSIGGSE